MKMDDRLAEAVDRYARAHGITRTAALSVLTARGLEAEGITVDADDDT